MEKNLTSGGVLQNIVRFSLPYLLSYFLQTLYGMADLFIIGQFSGTADITAVSIGSQVMHMLTVMIVGLAMGATITIGRAVGGEEHERAALAVGNSATLFMAVSLVLTAVLLVLVRPIAAVMSTPAEAVEGTVQYLTICFVGIPFITAYNIISSIFRGLGDSKSPMYFVAVACAANIGLDYLFIGGMGMGPAGAALGTTLSQTLSVVTALAVIRRQKTGLPLGRVCFKPRREVLEPILKVGVPVALQDGFIQVSFILITIIANNRGLNDAAAVGIVEKVISFVFLVPSSMLSTVSALAAQNAGAGKDERAVQTLRYAVILCLGFGLAVGAAVQLLAGNIVAVFDATPAVVKAGSQVHPGVHLGLHVRGGALQLQRIFLRLRQVGGLLSAQCPFHRAGADPGGVFHVAAFPRHFAADGLRRGGRVLPVGGGLRHRLCLAAPEGDAGTRRSVRFHTIFINQSLT